LLFSAYVFQLLLAFLGALATSALGDLMHPAPAAGRAAGPPRTCDADRACTRAVVAVQRRRTAGTLRGSPSGAQAGALARAGLRCGARGACGSGGTPARGSAPLAAPHRVRRLHQPLQRSVRHKHVRCLHVRRAEHDDVGRDRGTVGAVHGHCECVTGFQRQLAPVVNTDFS
jgi:hypothetical protein